MDVIDRRGTLKVQDDAFSVLPGSFDNALNVLDNDLLLTESTALLRIRSILEPALHGTLAINAEGTRLLYTPDPGFIGVERVRYRATDGIGGTGDAWVSIAVGRIETVPNFFKLLAATPETVELDVLHNDRMLPAASGSLTLTGVQPLEPDDPLDIGTLVVNGTGDRLAFSASGVLGEKTFLYTVADASVPPRTATGRLTLTMVGNGTYANPNQFRVRGGGSGYGLDVLSNDISYPSDHRTYSIVAIGQDPGTPDLQGTALIVDNQIVYTPAPGFFGEESFVYTMSDSVATDVARVTVSVRRGDLVAGDDAFAVYYEWDESADAPRAFDLPVALNDRIQPPLDQVFSIIALGAGPNAPDQGGSVGVASNGLSLVYRPAAYPVPAPETIETFTYEIEDGAGRRSAATVRVRVLNRETDLVAITQDDAFSVARNSVNNPLPVLANDFVRPGTASGWTLTAADVPTASGGTVEIAGTYLRYTPAEDFVGIDQFTYSVTDGLGGTGSATVKVRVGNLPMLPSLYAVLSDSGDNEFDVLANDVLFESDANAYVLDSVFGATHGGTVSLSASNTVVYTPDIAYPGPWPYRESFSYRVLDHSAIAVTGRVDVIVHDAESGRDTATITLRVDGRNDPPVILNEPLNTPITDKETALPFVGVTIIEVDQQLQEPVDVRVAIDDPAKGGLLALGPFVDLGNGVYAATSITAAAATTATRELVYEPVENRITVPTTETVYFTVTVTDNKSPDVIDTQTAIAVTAVNDPPVIAGTRAGQRFFYRLPVRPFDTVMITEVDDLTLQPLTITFTQQETDHGVMVVPASFEALGDGAFRATNLTAAAATEALRAVVFNAAEVPVAVGESRTTHFDLAVDDAFAPPVTDSATSVIALNAYAGTAQPLDPALQGEFGLAVDIRSDLAVVGAPGASLNGADAGAAFVYRHAPESGDVNAWDEWRQLLPPTVGPGDRFGRAVSLSESVIAVGAPHQLVDGLPSGSVYLFQRDLGGVDNWGEWLRLTPTNVTGAVRFGWSLDLSGDLLAVGVPEADLQGDGIATGAVFLFGRHQGGVNAWGEIMRWSPEEIGGNAADFGWSVALEGDSLIVGAPRYNVDLQASAREGAVFHFDRHAAGSNQWGWVQTITAVETNQSRAFGWDVAVNDRLMAVGAPQMTAGSVANAGRVYLYERSDLQVLFDYCHQLDRRNDPERQFGYSLALDGNLLLAGAPLKSPSPHQGAAFLFRYGGESPMDWLPVEKFTRPSGSSALLFGRAIGFRQGAAAVGAPASTGTSNGHVFFYRFDYAVLDGNPTLLTMRDRWDQKHFGDAIYDSALEDDLWGGTADPDDDGVHNDREYAFGGDPLQAGSGDVGMLWMSHDGDGLLVLQYTRRSDDPGLVFTLMVSTDLQNWFDLVTLNGFLVTEQTAALSASVEQVTLQALVPEDEPVLFFKIKADW